ncbi:MAG: indolepyruvate ferredoxin oxidoreductase subunit alpha [Chloroflexi bacterium]|nr:indolepyruvate ferredoxin oxidoreductase subunit alpha [Chloroflexota bacterium]MBM3175345.1 indolepyruvate ferredoxin oxidoreductase subunit alpha [Chloroflexota bacterium]MBM4450723.1 indolepyruvate ferredoxin oxidoreductase subunit alpha [Chloroflexota bacterium]
MKKLLSGNEAFALGAHHAGIKVATAYPGTPSTEILEYISKFDDVYAEWSTNEKVAMEVGLGASYAGVRTLVSMKHVGLNVASDPFLAAAITGVRGGLVVISADDPGIHSSQGEQDNRHYARLAKVPMLEPADSQEAYDLMEIAFDISEQFDTPVLMRSTTRISHANSLVDVSRHRSAPKQLGFVHDVQKYVMLPVHARLRRPLLEERLVKLTAYAETFPYNRIMWGERKLGIITSGVAYQYAQEVFPNASYLKLSMTYPLPEKLIHEFAQGVEKILVVEELDPFLEDSIKALGIKVIGKEFIPRFGELNPFVVEQAARRAGLLPGAPVQPSAPPQWLPARPPLLCPGCPHTSLFFVLSTMGQRAKILDASGKSQGETKMVITGDIGCYTLATYPPLRAMDTTACMGASIGHALGKEKAGISSKVVAVIGDSTFLHSGITGVVDGVYNQSQATIVILDNGTTAMTGHQHHPGTGVSAQGKKTKAVKLERLVKGIGVDDVKVVNAFDVKAIRAAMKSSLDNPSLSVVIVRGECAVLVKTRSGARAVDVEKCDDCGTCIKIGCPAIQKFDDRVFIDATLCAGDICTVCEQLCPKKAIGPVAPGDKS